jgi:hypothetical protein
VVPSPNEETGATHLSDVAGAGPDDIWAVGSISMLGAVTMHWNGVAWQVVPNPAAVFGDLYGVAVLSTGEAWAVGRGPTGPSGSALILYWNGMAWSTVPSPHPGSNWNTLYRVTALAADDVWAVGSYFMSSGTTHTLVMHWNGTVWSVVPSPDSGSGGSSLYGVAAAAPNDIWAVGAGGEGTDPGLQSQPLIEHWNGTAWSLIPSPALPTGRGYLKDVAVVNAGDVWAVGSVWTGSHTEALTEHWNGTAWSLIPSPPPHSGDNFLTGVGATAEGDVWAVGATNPFETLTLHWDGTVWTTIPALGPGELASIKWVPSSGLWTIGYGYGPLYQPLTLIAHYWDPLRFADVPPGSPFYSFIRCLACQGIAGGYPCAPPGEPCPGPYFRPNANVTRGQVSKIVAAAAGFGDPVPSTQQTFEDVSPAGTFWLWVERLSTRGLITGYPCGGPFEPCVAPANRPYFRPNNPVTRSQLAKLTSGAAGWTATPTGQTFEDVVPSSPFYGWIERLASRAVISGYPCGGVGEPCVAPANRPYFRPSNNATRAQMSKVAAAAFFPGCRPPPEK